MVEVGRRGRCRHTSARLSSCSLSARLRYALATTDHAISGANTIWLSGKSANQIDIVDVTQTVWQVAGIGDFDRDRRADILWRNARTGSNVIWQNGDYSLQRPVSLVSDIRWQVAAIGDYDADNESDIVWRHASTGQNEIWRSGQSGTPLPMTDIANREWFIASP